ncbi:MAG: SLC13 family permease [Thermoanaerobaculia bacterium]
MTLDIFIVLALLVVAMVFFTFEWLSIDIVTICLLVGLILSGILSPDEAFAGFASEIIVILVSVFVLSGTLVKTGVMDWLGHAIFRVAGGSQNRISIALSSLSAALSAVFSNTNSTAVLIPSTFELAKRGKFHPSKLLMPLAFASIMGGTCTLIGTSTNVAASGMLETLGYEPYSFFEFTAVGLVIVVVGILYLTFVGHRLLPTHPATSLSERYDIQRYLSAVLVTKGSRLAGKTLGEAGLSERGFNVAVIERDGKKKMPRRNSRLREGDLLIVEATREALLATKGSTDLRLEADPIRGDKVLVAEGAKLVEAFVMPGSEIAGKTVQRSALRSRYGVSVLALQRPGQKVSAAIGKLSIRVGDVLLLQGSESDFEAIRQSGGLRMLDEVGHLPFRRPKGLFAAGALLVGILAGSFGVVPLSVGLLMAAVAVVLRKCITPEEIYGLIEWRLIVLIGGMTSFGVAMQKTEAAEYLAQLVISWVLPFGIYAVMASLAILTIILTQPLSNAAAVLVILPVAISTALQLDVNPRTFAVLVTLSASLSFITPFEPACLLVYGPGGYRFSDFVKSGSVLTAISFVTLLLLVPRIWPL